MDAVRRAARGQPVAIPPCTDQSPLSAPQPGDRNLGNEIEPAASPAPGEAASRRLDPGGEVGQAVTSPPGIGRRLDAAVVADLQPQQPGSVGHLDVAVAGLAVSEDV